MATVKTAISLDEKLFRRANQTARKMKISRSRLIGLALRELLEHQRSREIIARLNEVYGEGLGEDEGAFLDAASRHMAELTRDEKW
ncbi:MAG: hypothetical protein ABFD92_12130 [Planctomycetaceae bacterium]|nr:hypothetical protein [Planctomycetaceae bacterium]